MTTLKMNQVVVPDGQQWTKDSIAAYGRLTRSIKENGLLVPIIVQEQEDGRFLLVDGAARLKAIKDLGFNADFEIPTTVIRGDEKDAIITGHAVNAVREQISSRSEYNAFVKLINKGFIPGGAAQALGKTKSWGSKMNDIRKLPDDVKAKVESGEIAVRNAIFAARFVNNPLVSGLMNTKLKDPKVSLASLKQIAGPVFGGEQSKGSNLPTALTDKSWIKFKKGASSIDAQLHLEVDDNNTVTLSKLVDSIVHAAKDLTVSTVIDSTSLSQTGS